jgi:hypothetical protein
LRSNVSNIIVRLLSKNLKWALSSVREFTLMWLSDNISDRVIDSWFQIFESWSVPIKFRVRTRKVPLYKIVPSIVCNIRTDYQQFTFRSNNWRLNDFDSSCCVMNFKWLLILSGYLKAHYFHVNLNGLMLRWNRVWREYEIWILRQMKYRPWTWRNRFIQFHYKHCFNVFPSCPPLLHGKVITAISPFNLFPELRRHKSCM